MKPQGACCPSLKELQLYPGSSVPDHGVSLGREGQGGDGTVVALQDAHTLAGAQVPHTDAAVHRGGEELQQAYVWMELDQTTGEENNRKIDLGWYITYMQIADCGCGCVLLGFVTMRLRLMKVVTYCTTPEEPFRLCVQYCFKYNHSFKYLLESPLCHYLASPSGITAMSLIHNYIRKMSICCIIRK